MYLITNGFDNYQFMLQTGINDSAYKQNWPWNKEPSYRSSLMERINMVKRMNVIDQSIELSKDFIMKW